MAKSKDTPARQEVTLKKRHKHAGRWHEPGQTIEVDPDQRARLRRHRIID